ncbi:class I SAM-dependent methyltransferase [Nocardiopsis halotolerans]|uniref:class I SAM-dependent methyltransferase n=1 Tax=Nocardiopsis halotolerans TaxID=124252 RepID=UPI00034B9FD5|nr:class I SAM-dependent methyltransferase [Nocardiopsis halotolerans]
MSGPHPQRGSSFYDRPRMSERYGQRRHGGVASPNTVMEEPALLRELGAVTGLDVLDLGCGDADLGRILLEAGCRSYLGVDGSGAMVERARARLRGSVGRVEHADMEDFTASPAGFDLVVSRLALHYVDDVAPVLASALRWLRPGGRMVFTVPHPVLTCHDARSASGRPRQDWVVDDYFASGPRQREWMGEPVTWHHRTVEDYVRALHGAGFSLTALRECAPHRESFEGNEEEYARRRRVPLFLLLAGARTG